MLNISNVSKFLNTCHAKPSCISSMLNFLPNRYGILYLVQTPAPVYGINITPYERAALLTWRIRTAPEDSSYITKIIIYLNRKKYETISRGTLIVIKKLEPNTWYQVDIETEDGSSQKSRKVSGNLNTKEAGKRSK